MRRIAKVMPSALTFSQSIVPFHSLTSMPLAMAPGMTWPLALTQPASVSDQAGGTEEALPSASKKYFLPSTVYVPLRYILPVVRSKK